MKNYFIIGLLLFKCASYGSEMLKKHLDKAQESNLQTIIDKRYLRVLTTKNPYDYYIYQGKTKGFQYEMVREFTKQLNKKYRKPGELPIVFEMIPVDFDQLIPMLKSGKGDIVAVGLTRTSGRENEIEFTTPYHVVKDVVVTRKELAKNSWKDKTFHVPAESSYQKELVRKDIKVNTVNPNFNPGELMEFVSLEEFDYTLMNSFWAKTISKAYPNLAIIEDVPFRKNVEISWAINKGSEKLLKELNEFLPKVKKGTLLGNLFGYKYFHDIGRINNKDFDLKSSKISPYDKYIQKYAKKFGMDWRLLTALCYQESRFDQSIVNKWGAIGLFQIKQMTADEPYVGISEVRGVKNFENNIHAGVKYLAWIKKNYFDKKPEIAEEDRLRMALASYNAGPRRVRQAIQKAKKMGLDPNKWFRNVELAMLKMGYPEPVVYVSEINKRYVSYVLLGIE